MTQAVDERVLSLIRRVIMEEADRLGVRVERIILFGSRARGEAREESDWDILIVLEGGVDRKRRRALQFSVYRRLGDLGIYADVLMVTRETLEKHARDPGLIYSVALREGVPV